MRWRLQRSMQYGRAIEEAVINCLGKVGLLSTGHGLGTFAEIKRMRCFRLRCTHGQVLRFSTSSLFVGSQGIMLRHGQVLCFNASSLFVVYIPLLLFRCSTILMLSLTLFIGCSCRFTWLL